MHALLYTGSCKYNAVGMLAAMVMPCMNHRYNVIHACMYAISVKFAINISLVHVALWLMQCNSAVERGENITELAHFARVEHLKQTMIGPESRKTARGTAT